MAYNNGGYYRYIEDETEAQIANAAQIAAADYARRNSMLVQHIQEPAVPPFDVPQPNPMSVLDESVDRFERFTSWLDSCGLSNAKKKSLLSIIKEDFGIKMMLSKPEKKLLNKLKNNLNEVQNKESASTIPEVHPSIDMGIPLDVAIQENFIPHLFPVASWQDFQQLSTFLKIPQYKSEYISFCRQKVLAGSEFPHTLINQTIRSLFVDEVLVKFSGHTKGVFKLSMFAELPFKYLVESWQTEKFGAERVAASLRKAILNAHARTRRNRKKK